MEETIYKCPVCSGTGKVLRPPWIPGDVTDWTTNTTNTYPCNACRGAGYIKQ